jgi:hypothetical protein
MESEKVSGLAPGSTEHKSDTNQGVSGASITARDAGNFYVTNTFTSTPHRDGTDHGLSGAPITARDTGNFYVSNSFTGTPHQHPEVDFEAMRQIVQGQAPPESFGDFHHQEKGATSHQHDAAIKDAISR